MQQLKQLGLTQLEKALPTLFETARLEQWTYEQFLKNAVNAEIEGRDRRAAERRMSAARLPVVKTLEAFDFSFQPSLSERLLWELADLSFVQNATNIILSFTAWDRENALEHCAFGKSSSCRIFSIVYHADPSS
jgi:DNA replication protein DnaC